MSKADSMVNETNPSLAALEILANKSPGPETESRETQAIVTLNIYEKIQAAKRLLKDANLRKTGKNQYFIYYELSDIMPAIIDIFDSLRLYSKISFTNDTALLTIINSEKPDEKEEYMSPMVNGYEIKGSNPMQAMGGMQTYQRRYLYMAALDITENDVFEAKSGITNNNEGNVEFNGNTPQKEPPKDYNPMPIICENCGAEIKGYEKDGKKFEAIAVKSWV
jgi:hypothetical protein